MSGIQEQLDAALAELGEANEEVIDLRSQLALRPMSNLAFYSIVHIMPQDTVVIFPVSDDLVGRAKVVKILRRAAAQILKDMKECS